MLVFNCCLLLYFAAATLVQGQTKDSSKNRIRHLELSTTARVTSFVTANPSMTESTDQHNGDPSGDNFILISARLWPNATFPVLKPDETTRQRAFKKVSSAIFVWSNSTEYPAKVETVQNSFEKKTTKNETMTFLAVKIAIITVASLGWFCCCTVCYLFLRQR